jgi:hypothetical protein
MAFAAQHAASLWHQDIYLMSERGTCDDTAADEEVLPNFKQTLAQLW